MNWWQHAGTGTGKGPTGKYERPIGMIAGDDEIDLPATMYLATGIRTR
jgi:hypothetical protein